MRPSEWQRMRTSLAFDIPGEYDDGEIEGLPDAVQRYFRASVLPGASLARAAEIAMRGRIRIGRWVPFRADELLAPHRGFVWAARAAGIVTGSDRYLDGRGAMEWKAVGLVPVMSASGPDISRSAAERAASEAVWVPTSLLPRFGVAWAATGRDEIEARFAIDDHAVCLTLWLSDDGLLRSVRLARWGDPDETGTFAPHPFGGDFTSHATFNGVTIPSTGSVGWHHGTDRWSEGEFFRFAIDGLAPIAPDE